MEGSSTNNLVLRVDAEDYGFGLNDDDFSDRVIDFEIIPAENEDPNSSVGTEVESLHINSLILAAKSPFFYKLFKNGMKESRSRNVSLKITASEKTALMDLLKFMYSNTLTATINSDLLEVLIIADKFEVSSCVRYCMQLLLKMPLSVESAVSYLELPSTVLGAKVVIPFIDAAKIYLLAHCKILKSSLEVAMKLSPFALEFVLGGGGLRVETEDEFFGFFLKWSRAHYPNLIERQAIISNRLNRFIRFPYLSCLKLKEVLVCPEFDREEVSKLVMEALFNKATLFESIKGTFSGLLYHDRHVKAAQLEFPQRHIVYFDLKKEECVNMSWTALNSQPFLLGGRWFSLLAKRNEEGQSFVGPFGLFLKMERGSATCTEVGLVVEVMKKYLKKYECCRYTKWSRIFIEESDLGFRDVLQTTWNTLMSDYER